jgi:hypothetical protein
LFASGGNFVIEIEVPVAVCRVWSRPDVDREEGARFALAKVDAFKRLIAEPPTSVQSVVLDMTRAPTLWGPVTQSCLERMVAMFESAGRNTAVVVSEDPLQGLQMQRIVRSYAPRHGKLFSSTAEAVAWARKALPHPPAADDFSSNN